MRFFTVIFLLLFCSSYSQDIAAYNAVYNKTALETAQKDFNKALEIADSLYKISETPVLKAKSLMLSATLYAQSGEFEKSIDYGLRSEKIIDETDNITWKARIYGLLATQYRYVRLFDKSKKYTELGIAITKEIPNPDVSNSVMTMMMQEMAFYWIEKREYKKSIRNLEDAQSYMAKTKPNIGTAPQIEQMLGYNYYHLGNYNESFIHYEKALELSKELPDDYYLKGLIYNGFSLLYIEKNELKRAKEYLDKALKIADASKYLALKNEVYETSEKYYAEVKNLDEYVKTREKHDTVKKTLQKNMQSFVNTSYSGIEKENEIIKESDSNKGLLIVIAIFTIILIIFFFIRYRSMQKKEIARFRYLLKELNHRDIRFILNEINPDTEPNIEPDDADDEVILKPEENFVISTDKMQRILDKLNEFEKSLLFKNNSMSLSGLASYCETSTKYISHIIKTEKNKDYSTYINDLRIAYIIEKLRSDPDYRKYKIAVLAEEAGFSSHNKFSLIFKKTTTLSPSLFIKYLETEENL